MWPVADKPANEAGLLRPLASPTRRPTCCEAECHDHKGAAGSVPACLHGGWGPSLPSLQHATTGGCLSHGTRRSMRRASTTPGAPGVWVCRWVVQIWVLLVPVVGESRPDVGADGPHAGEFPPWLERDERERLPRDVRDETAHGQQRYDAGAPVCPM